MKKGFTLIEILAVVTIMGLIFILVIPKIGTSLKHKKKDVDTTTNNLIITAAKNYVNDNHDTFDKVDNNIYCLPLTTLTKKDYLDSPVKNVTDDLDITNSKSVKITYNKGFKYEVVDKKECEVVYNKPREYDYFDSHGKGYYKVAYIESDGTKFIDTNYKPNQDTSVKTKFSFNNLNPNAVDSVFGSRISYDNLHYGLTIGGDNKFFIGYNSSSIRTSYTAQINQDYEIYKNKNTLIVNSQNLGSASYNNFSAPYSMYIFAMNEKNIDSNNSSVKLYYMQIYDGDDLVRDYVPVEDEDKVTCLFDKVESKCYYLIDEKISDTYYDTNNNKYIGVYYIESTGTQYIDTNYKPNQDTSVKTTVNFQTLHANTNDSLFGARISWDNLHYGLTIGGENKFFIGYDNSSIETSRIADINQDYGIYKNKNTLIVDSQNLGSASYNSFSVPYNMYIFAMNERNNNSNNSSVKLYYMQIYDGNDLVRDYIPVLDSSDRPCLYDQVEKQCYYNQGTGEFLYG